MTQFLLDTDHISLFENGHALVVARVVSHAPGTLAVSPITVEESLRGRLAYLSKATDGSKRIARYARMIGSLEMLRQFVILPFNQAAENQYQQLLALKLGVGKQDLKIAAVALVHQQVVVTRNKADFSHIPGLVLDDWSK